MDSNIEISYALKALTLLPFSIHYAIIDKTKEIEMSSNATFSLRERNFWKVLTNQNASFQQKVYLKLRKILTA